MITIQHENNQTDTHIAQNRYIASLLNEVAPPVAADLGRSPIRSGRSSATGLASVTRVVSVPSPLKDNAVPDEDFGVPHPETSVAQFPEVGDEFMGFRLVHELGKGGFGRVFLAKQIDLADRLVALKISVDLSGEPQRLAQLQHANIMPLYSQVQTNNLHAVCMPFFGCTTLADICRALRTSEVLPTSGKHLVSTLFNRQTTVQSELQSDSYHEPVEELPATIAESPSGRIPRLARANTVLAHIEDMTYENAILWIGSRLASGLHHAHKRGILHRDLKPANILLTDDGEPMILDFNLSEDVKLRTSEVSMAKMGGTLPYMSPEQLDSFTNHTNLLDCRSDIYSLGVILFQLLTGKFPFPVYRGRTRDQLPRMIQDRSGNVPTLRGFNSSVTPAAEAIVRRCLEADPDARYNTAEELEEDIERHLKDLPLLHTPEPSFTERFAKWSRRNPKFVSPPAIAAAVATVALVVTLSLSAIAYRLKERELDQHREVAVGKFQEFEEKFQHAASLLSVDDPEQVREGFRTGQEALAAYGILEDANWADRPGVKYLPPTDRDRLRGDVGELGFLLARAVIFQPKELSGDEKSNQFREMASANLGENDRRLLSEIGKDSVFSGSAGDFQELLNRQGLAEDLPARSRHLLACDQVAQGHHQEALKLLQAAVTKDPDDYGSWYLKAHCHLALNQHADAIASVSICIALRPKQPRAYYTRASFFLAQRKNLEQAKADLDQAIRLQPNFVLAYVDRAIVLYQIGKHRDALADLDWAIGCQGVPSRIYFIRAMVRDALQDPKGAAEDRALGLSIEPTDSISWVTRGISSLSTDLDSAMRDFEKAEALSPRNAVAIMNQAYVLGERRNNLPEAISALDRILEFQPHCAMALSGKAIYAARLGREKEAVSSIKTLLTFTTDADTLYRAACVYAVLSEKNPEHRRESLRLLAEALKRGKGFDSLATDSDLNLLRQQSDFKKFMELVATLQRWSKPEGNGIEAVSNR